MVKIKIIQVKGRTPEERKNLVEETQNINHLVQSRGSIYFDDGANFYADIFFIQGETPIKELNTLQSESKGVINPTRNETVNHDDQKSVTGNTKSDVVSNFTPTEEQLERWKHSRITKKTYGLLLAKGYSKEDIKNMKSQYDAFVSLKNLRKENI
jgi:hypothetical protein